MSAPATLTNQVVLITGAAGFVGSHLVEGCLAAGAAAVHAVVRPGSAAERLRHLPAGRTLHQHAVDLTQAAAVQDLINQVRPTLVYHLAAHGAYRWQTDPTAIFATNLHGTQHLLMALRAQPPQLLINMGSSSEYGAKPRPMRETDLPEPTTAYAVAKAAQTLLCQTEALTAGYPIVTFRLFTMYGPGEDVGKIIPVLLRAASTGQPLPLAQPELGHDYVFVADAVDALLQLAALKRYSGQIFNIGSGQQTTLRQLVAVVEEVTGRPLAVQWGAYPAPATDSHIWLADQTKTQRLLHWQANTDLAAGIQRTWQWYKQDHAS